MMSQKVNCMTLENRHFIHNSKEKMECVSTDLIELVRMDDGDKVVLKWLPILVRTG